MIREEDRIVEFIKSKMGSAESSYIGDDCAFLGELNTLITTDALLEGHHFSADTPPYALGWKTVAVNMSDIAAGGGTPAYITLSLSMPSKIAKNENWLGAFLEGILDCCRKFGAKLVGGDLTNAEQIYICCTALGRPFKRGFVSGRNNAKPSDLLIATGSFGGAGAGLKAIEHGQSEAFPTLLEHLLYPKPRIAESRLLMENVTVPPTMMDCSDGLLVCLQEIARQSGVKIVVDIDEIPLTETLTEFCNLFQEDPIDYALTGGEDYELIACIPPCISIPEGWTRIGHIESGEDVCMLRQGIICDNKNWKIFDHFGSIERKDKIIVNEA